MRVLFVEHPATLPVPPEGRLAVVDVAFAAADKYELATLPFIESVGDRLAVWIDHHEHPVGWARFQGDPRFILVPNRDAHACPELVTAEVVQRAGPVDVVLAHADMDGLLSAVKYLRGGSQPWPEADEDARAADSPGRGHAWSERGKLLALALDEASATLRSKPREELRQEIVAALVDRPQALPPALEEKLRKLAADHAKTLEPVDGLAKNAREEAAGVLVVRVDKDLGRSVKKALLSRLEEIALVGVVVEGKAVTAATYHADIDLSRVDELPAGRSDYRFAQATDGGRQIIARLGKLVRESR